MSATPSSEQMSAPKTGVKVRMYRHGLGDCFLLAFACPDPSYPTYVLIDSGTILGTPDSKGKMQIVAESVKKATTAPGAGKAHIDLLIVTHEHRDHVSGFLEAQETWQNIEIDKVWMAWTENPNDDLGRTLKQEFGNDVQALHLAVQRSQDPDDEAMAHVKTLLGMFGDLSAAGKTFSRETHRAMEQVRAYVGPDKVEYRYPGEVVEGVSGVKFYILGPPRSEQLLRDINPSAKDPETYTEKGAPVAPRPLALTEKASFTLALRTLAAKSADSPVSLPVATLSDEEKELHELCFPFEGNLCISREEAMQNTRFDGFFMQYYGTDTPLPGNPPPGPKWRRIDDDWLGVADELALQMDSYTNNTSLAFAVELPNTEKVLLFPADAQVGNWISWDDITKWTPATGEAPQASVADLMSRAVFYKVGHHGSHNATMRAKGLERMGPDLVAFVPVDTRIAHEVKRWMNMPFEPLLARLKQRTQGRVAFIDDKEKPSTKPEGVDAAVWEAFSQNLQEGPPMPTFENNRPLFYEYSVEDA